MLLYLKYPKIMLWQQPLFIQGRFIQRLDSNKSQQPALLIFDLRCLITLKAGVNFFFIKSIFRPSVAVPTIMKYIFEKKGLTMQDCCFRYVPIWGNFSREGRWQQETSSSFLILVNWDLLGTPVKHQSFVTIAHFSCPQWKHRADMHQSPIEWNAWRDYHMEAVAQRKPAKMLCWLWLCGQVGADSVKPARRKLLCDFST